MKRQPRFLLIAILFVVLLTLGYNVGCSQEEKPSEHPGVANSFIEDNTLLLALTNAPEFTVTDLNGKKVTSTSLKGKVVLLHFWATWCYYCRKEIPHLNTIYKQYADKGVAVLAVSLDRGGSNAVRSLMEKTQIDYPVAMGDNKISADFGNIRGLPTTFVINPQWQIVKHHRGYVPKEVLEQSIKELLKKTS